MHQLLIYCLKLLKLCARGTLPMQKNKIKNPNWKTTNPTLPSKKQPSPSFYYLVDRNERNVWLDAKNQKQCLKLDSSLVSFETHTKKQVLSINISLFLTGKYTDTFLIYSWYILLYSQNTYFILSLHLSTVAHRNTVPHKRLIRFWINQEFDISLDIIWRNSVPVCNQ